MPFGKHKGKPLSAVPRDYLEWLAGKDSIGTELGDAIRVLLGSAPADDVAERYIS
jgi:uncharacterized protein (DUF3820 family)